MKTPQALQMAYIRGFEEYYRQPDRKGASAERWADARQIALEKRSDGSKDKDLFEFIPTPPPIQLQETPIEGQKIARWLAEINKRMKKAGLQPLEIHICHLADKDGKEDLRVFGHTNHKERTICLSNRWLYLPPVHALGILVHEAGHEAAFQAWDNYDEEAADCAAFDLLDCEIWYRPPFLLQAVAVRDKVSGVIRFAEAKDTDRSEALTWG